MNRQSKLNILRCIKECFAGKPQKRAFGVHSDGLKTILFRFKKTLESYGLGKKIGFSPSYLLSIEKKRETKETRNV
jgi:hypothetical protein